MNIIMSRAIQQQYPNRLPPILVPTSPSDFTSISFDELELSGETLGSGSFGTVYKGRWRGRNVAVKKFKTKNEINSFQVEVKQLSCVNHPNIIRLYGASTSSDAAYLVMEYAEGGSLNHLLHESRQQEYDLRHACSWAGQAARGVAYLHEIRPKPIMHRDLKPANLLLFSKGKILKICDFGTACTVKTQMTNNTGSASYMAPEVFETSCYLESADVYSWSITFWEILARRQPYSFSNPFQLLWRVKVKGTRPNELENCPEIIWTLITKSWSENAKDRPTMRQVADEMELIFSLTDGRSWNSPSNTKNSQVPPSPRPMIQVHHHHNQQQQMISISSETTSRNYIPHAPSLQSNKLDSNFPPYLNVRPQCSNSGATTNNNRQLHIRSEALQYRLEMLQKRAIYLNKSFPCDKQNFDSALEEFEDLKKETELRKHELRIREDSSLNN